MICFVCIYICIYIYIWEGETSMDKVIISEFFFLSQQSAQMLPNRARQSHKEINISPLYVGFMTKNFMYIKIQSSDETPE